MAGIDRQSITDVNRVLLFLVDHPDLSACLNRMDSDVAAKALKDVESSIASFIPCLVDKVEVEFNDAKKVDDEARIQDIKQYLADIDGVCAFCQNVSPTCESQGKRIAVIASRVEDHIKSLSAKHRAMLEQAEHYLREIKTQDPTYVLAMIAAAWDEWEEALVTQAQVPKKKSENWHTYQGVMCENTYHVISHAPVMCLSAQISHDRIACEVVRDLVCQRFRDGVVVHLISK